IRPGNNGAHARATDLYHGAASQDPGSSMPSLPLLNSPLLLGAALLFQCALLQGIGSCPLGGQIHHPNRVAKFAATLGAATGAAIVLTSLVQQLLLHPVGLDYLDTFAAVIGAALSAHAALLILQRTQQLDLADRNTAALLMLI